MNTPTPFVTWIMEQTDNIGLNGGNLIEVYVEQRLGLNVCNDDCWNYVYRTDVFGDNFWDTKLGKFFQVACESHSLHDIQQFITQIYGENTP